MAAAQILGLDQQDAPVAGQPRAEAGPGDPATDDQDVTIAPSRPWLRFGKPHRLEAAS